MHIAQVPSRLCRQSMHGIPAHLHNFHTVYLLSTYIRLYVVYHLSIGSQWYDFLAYWTPLVLPPSPYENYSSQDGRTINTKNEQSNLSMLTSSFR